MTRATNRKATYTTAQVARRCKITIRTLYRWLDEGSIREPADFAMWGNKRLRMWSEKEMESVRIFARERGRAAYSRLNRLVAEWPEMRQRMVPSLRRAVGIAYEVGRVGAVGASLRTDDELLNVDALAKRLGVNHSFVYELTRSRAKVRGGETIPFRRVGTRKGIIFSWREVIEWLDKRSTQHVSEGANPA